MKIYYARLTLVSCSINIQHWIFKGYLSILKSISYEKYIEARRRHLKKHSEQTIRNSTKLQAQFGITCADAIKSVERFSEVVRRALAK